MICAICLDEIVEGNSITLSGCGHTGCIRDCYLKWVETQVGNGIYPPVCVECNMPLRKKDLITITGSVEKADFALTAPALRSMLIGNYNINQQNQQNQQNLHITHNNSNIITNNENVTRTTAETTMSDGDIIPAQTLHWLNQKTKQCPNCKMRIEREAGCKRIRCVCNHRFCWECGKSTTDGHLICKAPVPVNIALAVLAPTAFSISTYFVWANPILFHYSRALLSSSLLASVANQFSNNFETMAYKYLRSTSIIPLHLLLRFQCSFNINNTVGENEIDDDNDELRRYRNPATRSNRSVFSKIFSVKYITFAITWTALAKIATHKPFVGNILMNLVLASASTLAGLISIVPLVQWAEDLGYIQG